MKPKRANSRKAAIIPNSRWLTYATAGAASAFACAHSAEGAIHYSGPINRIISGSNRSFTFPLDQPGNFFRLIHFTGTNYFGYASFGVVGLAGASIAGRYSDHPYWASNLKRGQLISNRPFIPAQTAILIGYNGQFGERGIGYIGFKFNNGGGDQYGWVRIQTKEILSRKFILRDYAYGDVGDRIGAGQKGDQPNDLELESLGGLALGAAGLLAWRKQRTLVAQQS